ncbi:hypothetical protein OG792_15915 [Micromonospora sp. NBC_01699]|uniref:hypothetical protein n=1 Tax=Micromonospora sp. NBC_01699 TaxID=2975984 RepID=UPI002E37D0CB|nr:hypothetical protein [Micromonospora sp. NBC_01699]
MFRPPTAYPAETGEPIGAGDVPVDALAYLAIVPDVIALVLTAILAATITFGRPVRPRRPSLPAIRSRARKRWWIWALLLFGVSDIVAHEHLDRRTVLVVSGLLGAATAISLMRGLRARPRPSDRSE